MSMCSHLRVRAATLTRQIRLSPTCHPVEAMAVSDAGFKLKEALEGWRSAYLPTEPPDNDLATHPGRDIPHGSPPSDAPDPITPLAHVFHASISIYISGIFDYDCPSVTAVSVPAAHRRREGSARLAARRGEAAGGPHRGGDFAMAGAIEADLRALWEFRAMAYRE
ncbi:hypothetical protein E4U42_007413 [Claviceps africana]|uniref:Uncharacterized protein n=1 Tax=Claviceps africana TaxID=83212 RepID=A0A8K0J155_9HYPO|nr:hypothetical protein E4U42_007413 [Claviceps africana]